jgi:hypothetical protein
MCISERAKATEKKKKEKKNITGSRWKKNAM